MGVLGLPHALFGALLLLADSVLFGGGSGATDFVGGAALARARRGDCFSACQSPVLKCTSLEAPALVAAMAAAAEEILRGRSRLKIARVLRAFGTIAFAVFAAATGAVCAVCARLHCLYIKLVALRCLLH